METPYLLLRDVPSEERPRERMMQFGAQALSHAELLAILLRTGTRQESAVSLATRLLKQGGGLRGIVEMTTDELMQIKGIGPAKALQVQAGFELGKRLAKSRLGFEFSIRSPKDAADYLMEEMRYLSKEHFVCLFLNTKNQVVGQQTSSIGTLNASLVHPREVFRAAIQKNSASLIFAQIGMKNKWRNYKSLYPRCYINFAVFLMAKVSLKVGWR